MPFIPTNTAHVEYEVDGSGPGLVLVHGTGGSAEAVFGNVMPHFRGDRTVVRPNLPGSGRTVDNGGELTMDAVVEQIAAVTRAAVDGPVDLLGFSLGAAAATATAAAHPELVRRLILVGGWVHSTGPRTQLYFQTLAKLFDADRDLFKRVAQLTAYSPAAVDRMGHDTIAAYLADQTWPPAGTARQIDLCLRVDNRGLLSKITAPTLVIGLSEDQMVPIEGARELHTGIRGSRWAELPQGHLDWFADPTDIVKLTRDFIDADD
ncbi:alpha/beta hydrolase [Streptomyces sp. ISID311]|uniref:alpha/beta fold hydrolase n=1 Tax=Streptomyces sp. ISID311 TaxID=2601673 RepID=UPI0011BD3DC2|nr:alpha/beta hydrolase [Streptomyces sp. ISID311]TXC96220.1 alpha/beta hydrolase [Streptomyces sp. ISID311]